MTKHSSEHRHQKAVGQTTVKVEFFFFPFTCQLVPPYIVCLICHFGLSECQWAHYYCAQTTGLLLQCVPHLSLWFIQVPASMLLPSSNQWSFGAMCALFIALVYLSASKHTTTMIKPLLGKTAAVSAMITIYIFLVFILYFWVKAPCRKRWAIKVTVRLNNMLWAWRTPSKVWICSSPWLVLMAPYRYVLDSA